MQGERSLARGLRAVGTPCKHDVIHSCDRRRVIFAPMPASDEAKPKRFRHAPPPAGRIAAERPQRARFADPQSRGTLEATIRCCTPTRLAGTGPWTRAGRRMPAVSESAWDD